jgi:hypothetical protein
MEKWIKSPVVILCAALEPQHPDQGLAEPAVENSAAATNLIDSAFGRYMEFPSLEDLRRHATSGLYRQ